MASGEEQQMETKTIKFKHFDIIESSPSALSDHYYNSVKNTNPSSNNIPKYIAKEWRILEKNLPESIYVRAYEQRIDLLRAVIIGPSGTPYHDGLFFFDIHLSKDYPSVPPKVYYHSHGYRLNPNLYASGHVCLSLINTWDGKGIEKWVPYNSTILQVLVSIQGLVLNDKPFFNEPIYGHAKNSTSKFWVKKYLSYNKEAFIMSCKTLLHKLNTPPYGFEDLVVDHCGQRGEYLLAAIKDYYDGGSVIGHYSQGDRHASCSLNSKVKISSRYKSNLGKMHGNIVQAFTKHQILASNILLEVGKLVDKVETESDGKNQGKKKAKKGLLAKLSRNSRK